MQEPKAGRRIVSKGEYVKAQSKRQGLTLLAVFVLAWGAYIGLGMFPHAHHRKDFAHHFVFVVAGFITIRLCLCISKGLYKEARRIDTGVPLTRANTADLPAPDSLVRASQEPMQAQQGVLLRAASGEAQAGQEGQLLRASVGGQE